MYLNEAHCTTCRDSRGDSTACRSTRKNLIGARVVDKARMTTLTAAARVVDPAVSMGPRDSRIAR